MRTPRAINSLIDDPFERKYRKVGQEKNALGFFSCRFFCFNIVTPGKGSKYREFYDLSGRITCMAYFFGIEPSNFQAIPFSSLAYRWGMGLNGFLIVMSSYKGLGPKKAVFANQNEALGTFPQTTFLLC